MRSKSMARFDLENRFFSEELICQGFPNYSKVQTNICLLHCLLFLPVHVVTLREKNTLITYIVLGHTAVSLLCKKTHTGKQKHL